MIAKLAVHGKPTDVVDHNIFQCFKLVETNNELCSDNNIMNIDEIQPFFTKKE